MRPLCLHFFRWWMQRTFFNQKGWNNKAVNPNCIQEYFIGSLSMCSASLAVTSATSFTPQQTCGKPVMQNVQLIEKKKNGCIITVFVCTMQSSRVNKTMMCTVLQLEVRQCYQQEPCNTSLDTQSHKFCLLSINNLSAWNIYQVHYGSTLLYIIFHMHLEGRYDMCSPPCSPVCVLTRN